MSAYIVEKDHVIYLAAFAVLRSPYYSSTFSVWINRQRAFEAKTGDNDGAAKLATLLWRENVRSVDARYNEDSGVDDYTVSADEIPCMVRFDPVQVLKSCDCLEYQSCEHDGWEGSVASAAIDAIRHKAIHMLPGYDAAEWGAPKKPAPPERKRVRDDFGQLLATA